MRKTAAVAVLLLGIATAAFSASPEVAITPSPLRVDPQTNSAAATIVVRNPGQEPLDILLIAGDFVLEGAKEGMAAKTTFTVPGETPVAELQRTLAPNETVRIRLDVTNVWQAGTSRAPLLDHTRRLAALVATREQVAFNVAPADWKGDAPYALRFEGRTPPLILLKNDDPQTYAIRWSVSAPGLGTKHASAPLRIAGGETGEIRIPATDWLPARYDVPALLKDVESAGTLRLQSIGTQGEVRKTKTVPLKIYRSRWAGAWRNFLMFLVLALVVTAGGIASLLVTHWVPNRLRSIAVRELIESSSPKIHGLRSGVQSNLRCGVRVERMRLLQRLRSRSAFSPDFAALAQDCEAAANRLLREIGILERVDRLMRQIQAKWPRAGRNGPTLLQQACVMLGDAQAALDRPELNDAVVDGAHALVERAEATINNAELIATGMRTEVEARRKRLQELLDKPGHLRRFPVAARVVDAIGNLDNALKHEIEKLPDDSFSDTDRHLMMLDIAARFVEACTLRDPNAAPPQSEKFMEALRRGGFDDFRQAEALILQVRQNKFATDVIEEITNGRVSIGMEPRSPKVNQAVSFTLDFRNPQFHSVAARESIVCEWTFRHAPAPEDNPGWIRRGIRWLTGAAPAASQRPANANEEHVWKEKGLNVSHYFPAAGTAKVEVRFFDEQGNEVKGSGCTEEVRVAGGRWRAFGERTKVETSRLIIVLLVTVAGLLVGARDELAKLDLIPGLIAVFMVGFTADQIKNILAPPASP